jgi:hypothetical protein
MVTGESDSTVDPQAEPEWLTELGRLAQLVNSLLDECTRLGEENRRLRKKGGGDDAQSATLLAQLESERRSWELQRQAIADRIEVILGKFQWLETERAAKPKSLVDA